MILAENSSVNDALTLFWPALRQTFQMALIVLGLTVSVGVPFATCLFNVSPFGLFPKHHVYTVLSWLVSLGRSIPFLVLMAAIVPYTRDVVGTGIGVRGAIPPLTLGALPVVIRLVESALRSVPPEISEVAQVSGASRFKTILIVQWPEALPAVVTSSTIAIIGVFELIAVAGVIGAGGIGYLAISFGYNRFDNTVMTVTVVGLAAITITVQLVGDALARITRK
ncbi:methionine ABC transporter permease [Actinacidiphila yeochonensis]|uniref:methionine ABC transporter permease n=1 Tax=Actinacidiphila yeochonensis TaxID=89050 RepID=UPI00056CBC8C|nr:ABC transporter permease subunit [Actinacidiphila yeochonensis]